MTPRKPPRALKYRVWRQHAKGADEMLAVMQGTDRAKLQLRAEKKFGPPITLMLAPKWAEVTA